MRFFSLLPRAKVQTQQSEADVARNFLYELLRAHIDTGAHASHIQISQDGRELLGQIRIQEGGPLKVIVRKPIYPQMFSQVMTHIVKSAGLIPDSSSISQYDKAREIKFYAKNEFLVALFSCTASMPKTNIPNAYFKILNTKEFSINQYNITPN